MRHSDSLVRHLVNHALKGLEGSPAATTTTVADVRKQVLERLEKGEYPQSVLDEYSDNPFDRYTLDQLKKIKSQLDEALQRKASR